MMGWCSGVLKLVSWLCLVGCVRGIGANWGTQASHPLPPDTVVQMLRDNGFQKVKLFEAEDGPLSALSNSGIQVMVGIPNEMLASLASSAKAAEDWVSKNVSSYVKDGVDISLYASLDKFLVAIRYYDGQMDAGNCEALSLQYRKSSSSSSSF